MLQSRVFCRFCPARAGPSTARSTRCYVREARFAPLGRRKRIRSERRNLNPLAALEASRRKQHLYWLVSAVAKLVGEAAEQRPETVGKALVETLQKISDENDSTDSCAENAHDVRGTQIS